MLPSELAGQYCLCDINGLLPCSHHRLQPRLVPPQLLRRQVTLIRHWTGIGHALCAKYLARPNHTVIACIRNPSRPTSHLTSLFRGENTNLIISHIDSTDASTPSAAIARLQAQGITHLDLVIANAGICTCFPTAAEARLDDVRAHHEVNVLGPLAVFQATLPMLNHGLRPGHLRGRECGDGDGDKKRTKKKKGIFVAISSIGASISGMNRVMVPSSAYGPSKVALNYIMRKAHFENHERVCVFMVEPG